MARKAVLLAEGGVVIGKAVEVILVILLVANLVAIEYAVFRAVHPDAPWWGFLLHSR